MSDETLRTGHARHTGFGGRLREARERRGLTLQQIAASTKISMMTLEALEHDDAARLPGGIFSRSFVRTYASAVGLDPDETLREFLRRFPEQGAPRSDEEAAAEAAVVQAQRLRGLVRALLTVTLLAAAGFGGWQAWRWWSARQASRADAATSVAAPARGGTAPAAPTPAAAGPATPAEPARAPATAEPSTVAAEPAGGPSERPPVATVPGSPAAPPAPRPDVDAAIPAAVTVPAEGFRIDIHPRGPCWVQLVVDGELHVAKELQAGDRIVRVVRDRAILQVGDAGAFDYSLNGRPGRPIGGQGQVRRVEITAAAVPDLVVR
jgi:cytoskeletal protein RodZ